MTSEIDFYGHNGYSVIEMWLDDVELKTWREFLAEKERDYEQIPGIPSLEDPEVFEQLDESQQALVPH